jgi:ClpA/ClpB-like protein
VIIPLQAIDRGVLRLDNSTLPEHLLLSVLREDDVMSASILRDHKINVSAVRDSVRSAHPGVSSHEEADLC